MLFFSESNVLPQHGALRRGWLKLRLYLRRLAAIGAGAVELRGFFGAWTRFLGRLTRFFSWLENKLRQGWYRFYRAVSARLEHFFDGLHRNDALRWRLYDQDVAPLTFDQAFYIATMGGGEFFGKVGTFAAGYELDAVVLDDASLDHPQPLSVRDRVERAAYLADERNVMAKFVAGTQIF